MEWISFSVCVIRVVLPASVEAVIDAVSGGKKTGLYAYIVLRDCPCVQYQIGVIFAAVLCLVGRYGIIISVSSSFKVSTQVGTKYVLSRVVITPTPYN